MPDLTQALEHGIDNDIDDDVALVSLVRVAAHGQGYRCSDLDPKRTPTATPNRDLQAAVHLLRGVCFHEIEGLKAPAVKVIY